MGQGGRPRGHPRLSLLFTSVWPWYALAAMHYLDRAAGRALDDLRPLLSGTRRRSRRSRSTHHDARPPGARGQPGGVLLAVFVFLATARDTLLVHQWPSISPRRMGGARPR